MIGIEIVKRDYKDSIIKNYERLIGDILTIGEGVEAGFKQYCDGTKQHSYKDFMMQDGANKICKKILEKIIEKNKILKMYKELNG